MSEKPGAPSVSLAIRDEAQYLATVFEVRALAERCGNVEDAKDLSDKARALEVWARRQKLGAEKVALASAAQLWAKRREGELLVEMRENGERASQGRPEKGSAKELLGDFGITKKESHEAQQLAEIDAETFAEIVDEMVPEGRVNQKEIKRRAGRRQREQAKAEQEAELVRGLEERGGPDCTLTVSDLRSFDPGPVEAIVTDPPYITDDAVELYAALGEFARRTLVTNGALVVMTWQPILPAVLRVLDHPDLTYRWTCAWVSGAHETTADYARRVNDRWKPVLVYHVGGWHEKAGMLTDVISTGRDSSKSAHVWQQDLDGFRQLIRAISKPGDRICDPFLGSGTTALAALAENRSFVGCDVDSGAIETTRLRLTA